MNPKSPQPVEVLAMMEAILPISFSIRSPCVAIGSDLGNRLGIRIGRYLCVSSTWSKDHANYRESWEFVPGCDPELYPESAVDLFPASAFEISGIIGADISTRDFQPCRAIKHRRGVHLIGSLDLGYSCGPARPFNASVDFYPSGP